jgi:hypothetical protein
MTTSMHQPDALFVAAAAIQNIAVPSGSVGSTRTWTPPRIYAGSGMPGGRGSEWATPNNADRLYGAIRQALTGWTWRPPERDEDGRAMLDRAAIALSPWLKTSTRWSSRPPVRVEAFRQEITTDDLRHSAAHGLLSYLLQALALISESFPTVEALALETMDDPDTGEVWINIDVKIDGDLDDVMAGYDRYAEQWARLVPWPAVSQISVTCDIA